MFADGPIDGVLVRPLKKHVDGRGWLLEIFRDDEIPQGSGPVMAYVSETLPGVARGPHEHIDQTDLFGFCGPSTFRVYLWDKRPDSPTRGQRQVVDVGENQPAMVIIPPGVVHAYRNIGSIAGWVFNAPNRLYKGVGRQEPVDEIRHEDNPDSPYLMD